MLNALYLFSNLSSFSYHKTTRLRQEIVVAAAKPATVVKKPEPAPPVQPPPSSISMATSTQNTVTSNGSYADPEATQQSVYDYEKIRLQNEMSKKMARDNTGKDGVKNDSKPKKRKRYFREGAGRVWEDKTLAEWPENDFRIFVGDLGNEVTSQLLGDVFKNKFKSFAMAKVMRKKNNKKKGRGFGFVSFLDPNDMVQALRTMNGKYCGTRPMKLRKCEGEKRSISAKKARKLRKKNELKLYDAL